jgi:CheY-like chemotaxis protein
MGLGLAIVRRLARLLDHPLEFASTPGHGSRFSIAVPRASASVATVERRSDVLAMGASSFAGARIAVIDDEAAVVDGMRAWFEQWGASVVGAASGDAVLAALGEAGAYPDLIVADYRLAGGELGTDVIARLRHELGLQIPALLVSGDASAEALAAMHGCALDVLLKPVLPEALRMLVERLLARDTSAPAREEIGVRVGFLSESAIGCAAKRDASSANDALPSSAHLGPQRQRGREYL